MVPGFDAYPGRLFVVATLLPLLMSILLLVGGSLRAACRPARQQSGIAGTLYWLFGGDKPLKTGAVIATSGVALAALLTIVGLVQFLSEAESGRFQASRWAERVDWVRLGPPIPSSANHWDQARWFRQERVTPPLASALHIGYRIDHLTAIIMTMVTVISTAIFLFSFGYMKDELAEQVEDHEVDLEREQSTHPTADVLDIEENPLEPDAPAFSPPDLNNFSRRGRFGRFYLYLSLFCFSMLNLVIADNLFQVFVSWELVGVCSFFLIGFYYERPSAARAANKAFIINRIGDAGFLIGILIAWTYLGTLNFEEMFHRVRMPESATDGKLKPQALIRVNAVGATGLRRETTYSLASDPSCAGTHLALFPLARDADTPRLGTHTGEHAAFVVPDRTSASTFGVIPYLLFVILGIGIFLGCVGKSAQFPLHTWLPDAMAGPTPVSALIHAATMVAAGVYLVGRCYPLFAPEVLLVIAYTGAMTLFMAASIALVQTDIKRILAYSTCSQLGFMMLALGLGGWIAGLLHLITHAFFKALLFLSAGSVITGCHHEQDVRKMGGLRRKMPITAYTMLVGVLAISGFPLLSGWYSKDQILTSAMEFAVNHPAHLTLLILPLIATAFTAYYMFRLWFLIFTGSARDEHLNQLARESPTIMTFPLIFLAVFSVGIGWGWPVWVPEASYLGELLKQARPACVHEPAILEMAENTRSITDLGLIWTGGLPLVLSLWGAGIAYRFFVSRPTSQTQLDPSRSWLSRFLFRRWYFDELYSALIVKPTLGLAHLMATVDRRPTDRLLRAGDEELPGRRFDFLTLDGLGNSVGQTAAQIGQWLRVVQNGLLRSYILALTLTATLLLVILVALRE